MQDGGAGQPELQVQGVHEGGGEAQDGPQVGTYLRNETVPTYRTSEPVLRIRSEWYQIRRIRIRTTAGTYLSCG